MILDSSFLIDLMNGDGATVEAAREIEECRGWPVEAVGDSADVSREVLDNHYDMADQAEKRERREQFLDRL